MMLNNPTFSLLLLLLALLAGCSTHTTEVLPPENGSPTQPEAWSGLDGATPRFEPPSRIGNQDYVVLGREYKVWNGIEQYSEEGKASWYGPGFHGLYTSNGELYDQEGISAAHKNLPLPSYLKVANLDNGKTIIVRVNDRGPFHGDRILDLSHGAAKKLGLVGPGTAHVKVTLIKPPLPANAAELIARHEARTIQLMATSSETKARAAARALTKELGKPVKVVSSEQIYRLQMGPLAKSEAEDLLSHLKGTGYHNAFFIN